MVRVGRIISWLTGLTSAVGSFFVILLILHITLDVFLRFAFNKPLSATIIYVSVFYMIAISFLSLSSVEEKDAHISVELLTGLLPRKPARIVHGFSLLLTLLVVGALTLRTWQEAVAKYNIGSFAIDSGAKISTWPSYFLLPVGLGLMLIVVAYKFVCFLTGARSGLANVLSPTIPAGPEENRRD